MRAVAAHRSTTAHLQAAYPFVSASGSLTGGVVIGRDLLGGVFSYDAFTLYEAGLLSSPNMVVAGQLGRGKSALIKTFLLRELAFGRRVVVMDPKGEYAELASACCATSVRLRPGGSVKLNPLDRRVAQDAQLRLLLALGSAALKRTMRPTERIALELAFRAAEREVQETTITQVVYALLAPLASDAKSVGADSAAVLEWGRELAFELRRLVSGDLRGMFDQQTSASVALDDDLVVLDLSALYDSDALGILMVCAAAWLQGVLLGDPQRKTIFVVDEAWAILSDLAIARWLQASFKLSRAKGLQNVAVIHRFSDLTASGSEGSAQERVARGLLSDTETRVVYAQPHGEIDLTRELLGLTRPEAELLPHLERGVALWKVGERSFLVRHDIGEAESMLVDTDRRMRTGGL